MKTLKEFWRDTSGATSIEYAIIGALASILLVAGARAIGLKLNTKISPIGTALS